MTNEDQKAIDIRLLAIAVNAVREGRIAKSRDSGNWNDNDAFCVDNIHNMLRQLQNEGQIDHAIETLPLRDHSSQEEIPELTKRVSDLFDQIADVPIRQTPEALKAIQSGKVKQ